MPGRASILVFRGAEIVSSRVFWGAPFRPRAKSVRGLCNHSREAQGARAKTHKHLRLVLDGLNANCQGGHTSKVRAGRIIAGSDTHPSPINQRGMMLADYSQHLETEAGVGEVGTALWPTQIQCINPGS